MREDIAMAEMTMNSLKNECEECQTTPESQFVITGIVRREDILRHVFRLDTDTVN